MAGNPPLIFSTNANENLHVILEDILGREGGQRASKSVKDVITMLGLHKYA